MRVLVDLDGVCAELLSRWVDEYNKKYNDSLSHELVDDWDALPKLVVKECGDKVYDLFSRQGIFKNLPVVPGAYDGLKAIIEMGHDIVFVTATPGNSLTGHYEKRQWVKKNFPFTEADNFISTDRKDLIIGDVLIDDSNHHIENFHKDTILFKRKWNKVGKKGKGKYVAEDWKQVVGIIEEIASQKGKGDEGKGGKGGGGKGGKGGGGKGGKGGGGKGGKGGGKA